MKFPKFPIWLAGGMLALCMLLVPCPSAAHGQCSWFHKFKIPCPEPLRPAEIKPPDKKPDDKKPVTPQTTPEPFAEQTTTAALSSDQVSISMFGDRGGSSGVGSILQGTPKSFSNYFVFNGNSQGGFIQPVPADRLAFAPGKTAPIVYLQSGPGAGPGPVKQGQVIPLDNDQPNFNANGQPLAIQNGTATITGFSSGVSQSIIPLASGSYTQIDQVLIAVPNPGAGGVVGRARLSEDLNPMPRDRFIFNYDFFNQVPLSPSGQDVHRYVLGVEKTFFDRMASLELRMPFASTMSSDIVSGIQTSRVEFGDLRLLLKTLLYSSRTVNVASGLGVSLPTARDTNVATSDGTDLVHIANRAVLVSPYIGILFTPNDRLFAQMWVACDFDTNGCPVEVTDPSMTALQNAGRIQDQTLMQWDLQVGYWLRTPGESTGLIRGFAPFGELHYGTTLNSADFVQANGFVIGNFANRVDELNIVGGFAAQIQDNLLVSVGAAAPLRQDFDRSFDWQVGVRASLFFGPTAAQRRGSSSASATSISSF